MTYAPKDGNIVGYYPDSRMTSIHCVLCHKECDRTDSGHNTVIAARLPEYDRSYFNCVCGSHPSCGNNRIPNTHAKAQYDIGDYLNDFPVP